MRRTGTAWAAALWAAASLAAGCACERRIGIEGDTGSDGGADPGADGAGETVPWDPPIENMGEPGWEESTEPFCWDRSWDYAAWQVWSDPRGVFVQVDEKYMGGSSSEDVIQRFSVMHNDGTGWAERFDDTAIALGMINCSIRDLQGIPGGALYLLQYGPWCEWGVVTDGSLSLERSDFSTLFVVDETLAYAIGPGLVYFDGTSWGPYTETPPRDAGHIWADRSSLFLAGGSGIVMSRDADGWTVHDTHTLEGFSTIWGFGADDVWAGTEESSLFHWDGVIWEEVEWPDMGESTDPDSCRRVGEAIRGMWGADGTLFFYTSIELVMHDASGFRVLIYSPGEDVLVAGGHSCTDDRVDINDVWGNSATEVFVAVNSGPESTVCWPTYLLWWDGAGLHRF